MAGKTDTKPQRRQRVQRLEEWDGARYSIVPADAWRDGQLTLAHFRVLGAIGRVNTQLGWCEFSQKAFAVAVDCRRQTVSEAIGDLVRWRYVEMRSQKLTRSSVCHYRILIDDPAIEAEAEHLERGFELGEGVSAVPDTPQDAAVSGTGDTPPDGGVSATADTRVSLQRTPVSAPPDTPIYKARAREIRDQRSLSPLSPQGGAWASGWTLASQRLVDEMRSSPLEGRIAVAEHFVDAIRATLTPPRSVDAEAYTRQLANRLSVFAADVLAATAQEMINTRGTSLPAAIDIEKVAKTIAARTVAKPAAAAAGVAAVACNPALADRWDVMRDELRSQLGDDVFAAWYGGLAAVRLERGMLELGAPASFTASWLRQHHGPAMLAAARAAFGPEIEHVTVISQQGKAA